MSICQLQNAIPKLLPQVVSRVIAQYARAPDTSFLWDIIGRDAPQQFNAIVNYVADKRSSIGTVHGPRTFRCSLEFQMIQLTNSHGTIYYTALNWIPADDGHLNLRLVDKHGVLNNLNDWFLTVSFMRFANFVATGGFQAQDKEFAWDTRDIFNLFFSLIRKRLQQAIEGT